jgi:hypothetical protein
VTTQCLDASHFSEHLQHIRDTRCVRAPPPALLRLLKSKVGSRPPAWVVAFSEAEAPRLAARGDGQACRSALMFGDRLLRAECVHLVHHLARTRLPFQCAHGRPTVTSLVADLRALADIRRTHEHST